MRHSIASQKEDEAVPVMTRRLLHEAADLMTQGDDNPEYDRAIVELVSRVLGVSTDDRDVVEAVIRGLQE